MIIGISAKRMGEPSTADFAKSKWNLVRSNLIGSCFKLMYFMLKLKGKMLQFKEPEVGNW